MRQKISTVWLFAFFATFGFSPQLLTAGWPWNKVDPVSGYQKHSPEYDAYYATIPPGSTRTYHHGMACPPYERPCGPERLYWQQYHAVKYWPYPYNIQDRAMVYDSFDLQAAAGWKSATTLYDYHFNSETQELNSAGKEQVKWIMSNAPSKFRQAYVAASLEKGINDARLSSVQNELAYVANGNIPVVLRVASPTGRSAIEVDSYQKSYLENMPIPHITNSAPAASGP